MMDSRDDRLHAMCHRYDDLLSKPVWIVVGFGDMYMAVSDGNLAVFLAPSLLGKDPPRPDDIPAYLQSTFEKFCGEVVPGDAVLTTTQDILAWTGDPKWGECGLCGGRGEADCECHCGDQHNRTCSVCDGTGDGKAEPGATVQCRGCRGSGQGKPAEEPGKIVGALVNRSLLARIASVVGEGDCVVWANALQVPRISLRGDGWRATLMGVRGESTCPPFPAGVK